MTAAVTVKAPAATASPAGTAGQNGHQRSHRANPPAAHGRLIRCWLAAVTAPGSRQRGHSSFTGTGQAVIRSITAAQSPPASAAGVGQLTAPPVTPNRGQVTGRRTQRVLGRRLPPGGPVFAGVEGGFDFGGSSLSIKPQHSVIRPLIHDACSANACRPAESKALRAESRLCVTSA